MDPTSQHFLNMLFNPLLESSSGQRHNITLTEQQTQTLFDFTPVRQHLASFFEQFIQSLVLEDEEKKQSAKTNLFKFISTIAVVQMEQPTFSQLVQILSDCMDTILLMSNYYQKFIRNKFESVYFNMFYINNIDVASSSSTFFFLPTVYYWDLSMDVAQINTFSIQFSHLLSSSIHLNNQINFNYGFSALFQTLNIISISIQEKAKLLSNVAENYKSFLYSHTPPLVFNTNTGNGHHHHCC